MIKLTERSIYDHITQFLRDKLKAKAVQEVKSGDNYADIFFQLDAARFIVEIKIGGEKEFREAIAKVYEEYVPEYATKNIIIIVYPKQLRGQVILDIGKLSHVILSTPIMGRIHTDYWTEWVERIEVSKLFEELERRFRERDIKIDFNSVVNAIREIVPDLYEVIRQAKTEEIFEEVTTKLELFAGLGEIKDKQKVKTQVSMLASYLLFNQLLFYHVYKTKTKDEKLEELKPVKSLKELNNYFNTMVKSVDYGPIYDIKLVNKIPERSETLKLINDTIKNLVLLRAEHITQDLAGRFFHALLPKEIAKVWAAFYTNPTAAEILAALAIDKWDEKILDPACGSGTLLSAAYRRKLELYKKEQAKKKLEDREAKKLHKKFMEEDITGIDIMPFAAHLTTINLSSQKLEQPTNVVRIARMDSLELAPKILTKEFRENGILLKPFTEEAQLTLKGMKKVLKRKGTVSPAGIGKEFYLKPVDVVIMNPPFSDREKLPQDYREKLNEMDELGKICGRQINLWGYFLALADLILKQNGKIALVVPFSIMRGKATEKVRNYLLENYHIKFIIKSAKDFAFSESAAFRDILLIAEKRKPKTSDLTKVVFLKRSVRGLDLKGVHSIVKKIKSINGGENLANSDFEILKVSAAELFKIRNNLMPLISTSFQTKIILDEFNKKISMKKLTKIEKKWIRQGYHTSPAGLSELVYITRPFEVSRMKRAFLILNEEKQDHIIVKPKNMERSFKIDRKKTTYGLRTITGIKNIDITKTLDYLVLEEYPGFKEIEKLSKWKGKFNWKVVKEKARNQDIFLAIPEKFNPYSPNTHVFAICSEKKFIANQTFRIFINVQNAIAAKYLCLYLNSIVFMSEALRKISQATGAYTHLTSEDLASLDTLNLFSLTTQDKKILITFFEKIKNVSFPSILEQFEKRFWARIELDKTILKILGFSDKEIEKLLPKIYDAIVKELKAMREVK